MSWDKKCMENDCKRVAAIITAAGMSTRMGAFKPLLKIEKKTVIEGVIDTLRSSGIEDIVVITGNRANEIESIVTGMDAKCILNERYKSTHMLDSARLGFKYLQDCCDTVFFLPVDVPMFSSYSLRAMLNRMREAGVSVIQPLFNGQPGHLVLIAADFFTHILAHNGSQGLRGAFNSHKGAILELELPDPGLVMDMDTPPEYHKMCEYFKTRKIPSVEICIQIHKWFNLSERTAEHCTQVSNVATQIASDLKSAGYHQDMQLLKAGALLHDIAKGQKNHAAVGSQWLRQMSYDAVAEIVATHIDLPEDAIEALDARAIVYLADKLVKGSMRVSLEERFTDKYYSNEAARIAASKRFVTANRVFEKVYSII